MNRNRRRFLSTAAMTVAASQFPMISTAQAKDDVPRELAAIGRATDWLNSPRLAPSQLLGKVIVVNFCTYTCINWLRTLPYVRAWAAKYTQGLVVLGVHTPEFAFEKNLDNVRRAVKEMRIDYPIVIDNDYSIWRAFRNQYWPALYFVDPRGRIREHHFGEGEYEQSENKIRKLLTDAGVAVTGGGVVPVAANGVEWPADWANLKSPENYLGLERTANFASPGGGEVDRSRVYGVPKRLAANQWALAGEWTMSNQAVALMRANGRLEYRFHARDLHLVMGPARRESPVRFRVSIDGQPPGAAHGFDVDEGGNGIVVEQRLYQLIRQPGPIVDRQFQIEFSDPGVEAFAFTFG
ncbi:MAG TPA: redoxin domain-containing protein [Vicinamibacterales bacterium]|nr:redoxin domain-containing protein [Vicinamibacterales bacterium]